MFLTTLVVNKNIKIKGKTFNHFHNILRLFDVLPNLPFNAYETMGDYCLKAWYIRVAERFAKRHKT